MKLTQTITLAEAAGWLGATYAGDGQLPITGINEIHKVVAGDLTFVDFHKYYDKALHSAATFIIINKQVSCPEGKGLIFSDDPFSDYVKLVKRFAPFRPSLKKCKRQCGNWRTNPVVSRCVYRQGCENRQ